MESDKSLVSLLAESLVGTISKGKPMNKKSRDRFYSITGQLSDTIRRQHGSVDFPTRLSRYIGQRAMLTGMKDNEFIDAVCKSEDLRSWENLMFYNYV
ncbi:MAG: hypothetical protein AABW82_01625 [Nanoarchaeota archaeon]